MTLHVARTRVPSQGKGVAQHGNGMDFASHGMRDVEDVRGVALCVVWFCVRGVCICVQASPTASSTSTAPALHPGLRDEARTPTDAATPTRPRSLRKKLRPTTHSYLPAFSRRTCIPTVPLTRHFVFASIANSATRVHVNLELSALCSLHSPKVPDQHQ